MDQNTKEPSVLDYVKSKLFFWRGQKIEIPAIDALGEEHDRSRFDGEDFLPSPLERKGIKLAFLHVDRGNLKIVVLGMASLFFALVAQLALEPPSRGVTAGLLFYLIAGGWMSYLAMKGFWSIADLPKVDWVPEPMTVNKVALWASIPLILVAFVSFGGNRFTLLNVLLWFLAFFAMMRAFWLSEKPLLVGLSQIGERIRRVFSKGVTISPWTFLLLLAFGVAAFFRFYHLSEVPKEMFSDHAEKLLDVMDVLAGQTHIFFVRNTGREAFQFYLTALIIKVFGTGISFLSLKLGTGLAGLFTLLFIYLLGKEIATPRVGLFAMFFAGISYWLNVISRVALRFTLYPFFAAPALYFLIRGLRRRSRNDLILSGVAVGLGLHGYSPFRFVPLVIVIGVIIYLLHRQSKGARKQIFLGLILLGFVSFVVFLPLLRFIMSNPEIFTYRTLTRLTSIEQPLPGNPIMIFLKNLGSAMIMFFWDNGEIWVHSVPHRPALGVVSAVLLFFGALGVLLRYLRQRNWVDIFILVSIPLLMMPSVLSLAFPAENPSLNRTGGAAIPVFLLIGLGFDSFLRIFKKYLPTVIGRITIFSFCTVLLMISVWQNYNLVFNQYDREFKQGAWNSSEMGHVIHSFAETIGDKDHAWVVPYPYWVDTRLVGINAGFPRKDYALWPEDISETLSVNDVKLFLLKPEDQDTLDMLGEIYPDGYVKEYNSAVEGKNFLMYFVPASMGGGDVEIDDEVEP